MLTSYKDSLASRIRESAGNSRHLTRCFVVVGPLDCLSFVQSDPAEWSCGVLLQCGKLPQPLSLWRHIAGLCSIAVAALNVNARQGYQRSMEHVMSLEQRSLRVKVNELQDPDSPGQTITTERGSGRGNDTPLMNTLRRFQLHWPYRMRTIYHRHLTTV